MYTDSRMSNEAGKFLNTAEVFDPGSETFTKTGAMNQKRDAPVAVLLTSGKVLIAGGSTEAEKEPFGVLRSAELHDPQSGTFEKLSSEMSVAREAAAAARLPDGRVLIVGGHNETAKFLASAEVFNPATGAFERLAAELATPADYLSYSPLPNGEILIAGGEGEGRLPLSSAEKFNPETLAFEALGTGLLTPRNGAPAALLPGGQQVIVLGGGGPTAYLSSAEVLSLPPSGAMTLAAAGVATRGATLNGSVLAEAASSVHFQYGTSAAYGSSTAAQTAGPAIKAVSVSASVTGLLPNTTYHFRLVAEGYGVASFGADQTFTTPPAPGSSSSTPPNISGVSQSHRSWREGSKLASIARSHAPVGTTFSFMLSQPARVAFAFTQSASGRRVHHRCVAPTRSNHTKPRCTRTLTRGTLSFSGHQGTDKVAFQGRLSSTRRLAPGTYTLLITARNAAGQVSPASRLTFTIVK